MSTRQSLLIVALLILTAAHAPANDRWDGAAAIAKLRAAEHLSSEHVDALAHVLELREANRQAIRSIEAAYTTMIFSSPKELQKRSEETQGRVPVKAIPNPQVDHRHYIRQGPSMYLRIHNPSNIIPYNPSYVEQRGGPHFALLARERELVVTEVAQFSVVTETPLIPDKQLSRILKQGMFSRDDNLEVSFEDRYMPEKLELAPLEMFITELIVNQVGVLDDLREEIDEYGKRVLIMEISGDNDLGDVRITGEMSATYSLDDNGLLIRAEMVQHNENNVTGDVTTYRHWMTDTSFVEFETEDERVVLPIARMSNHETDGELRTQHLLIVDEESLRVNEEFPEELFRVDADGAAGFAETYHVFPPPEERDGDAGVFRTVDDLPDIVRPLAQTDAAIDPNSSAVRFPFDRERTERLLDLIRSGKESPFGEVELAQYAQKPAHPMDPAFQTMFSINPLLGIFQFLKYNVLGEESR